jgi:beta-glucosidase
MTKPLRLLFNRFAICFFAGSLMATSADFAQEIYQDSHAPTDQRVDDLLARLSQDEKIKLIGGAALFQAAEVKRLGIPSMKMSDGPCGVKNGGPSTVYACGIALAASWDVALAKREGTSLGSDARARGDNILLGPGMDMYRAPLCGRNFEYFGEDPILSGRIASGYIQGVQSQGVAATMKHFVANDQEFDRVNISSTVDERTLREIYLKPFEIALREAGPWCVMDSYNPINGVRATANDWLNNQVLKGEWNFRGILMSDWEASHEALGTANGGLDLEMPGPPKYFKPELLSPLLASGKISQETLDDKVRRILRVMVSLGFLDRPQLDSSLPKDNPDSNATALAGAREGIVLLKNQGNLLPLSSVRTKKIVILGRNADPAVAVGGGSGHAEFIHAVSVLQGLKDQAGNDVQITRVPWSTLPPETDFSVSPKGQKAYAYSAYGAGNNPALPPSAIDAIKKADVAVVCVGFNDNVLDYWGTFASRPDSEGEAHDRTYHLPPGQEKVIEAVVALNPRTVVILNAGGSVATAGWIDKIPVLLDAFYPGQAGGDAVAEILFGKTNPSGRLPFSWEKKWEDSPAYGNYPTQENHGKNDYQEGVFLGYRWFDSKNIAPLFPFGFGLSYSSFLYSGLQITEASNGDVAATFSIQNTSQTPGCDVAQLYIVPPTCLVPRPVHELKGFARICLQPGETKSISIQIKREDLAYWNPGSKQWTVTSGMYFAQVGPSSRALPLAGSFKE